MGAAEELGGALEDGLGYAFRVGVHFAVPEADDGPAFGLEMAGSSFVAGRTDVLAAVDLDDQLRLAAGEIGYVGLDRELAGEFGAVAGEEAPEGAFLPGRVGAQVSGSGSEAAGDSAAGHFGSHNEAGRRPKIRIFAEASKGTRWRAYPPPAPPLQGGESVEAAAAFSSLPGREGGDSGELRRTFFLPEK